MTKFVLPLAVIALLMSFFRLGSVTLFDVDEAVFSQATKEMVESGDWITPTYNGENRFDKPILFYWLMAASYKVFGINEFGARFPSALSGFLLCLALFFFVRRFHSRERAFYAAVPLALSPYFFVYSHAAVTDMALTLFLTLALLSFFLSLERKEGAGRSIYGLYVFSALAFLTKGLIGILFPFGIAVVYQLFTEGIKGMRRVFSPAGMLLFLLLSAPWYVVQLQINGSEFIQQFFVKHHFKRFTGVISGHRGPFYYYLPALIIGLLPWVSFLPGGIRAAVKDRKSLPEKSERPAEEDAMVINRDPDLGLFALVWFTFVFVFFSLSTTKLPNYILPAIPAACILVSTGMAEKGKWRTYANAGIAVIMIATGVAFLISEKYLVAFGISDTGWILPLSLAAFAAALVSLYAALAGKTFYRLISVMMAVFLMLLSAKALPLASRELQGTLHKYSLLARERLDKQDKVVVYGMNHPSIVFYSDRKIVRVGNSDELMPLLSQGRRLLVIARAKEVQSLARLGFHLLEEDGRYAVLEKQ
jgi:4-amino-4-deoxy-L-arabinose transferase-like glycosyltransferase